MTATAAKGRFPYPHRTLAEIAAGRPASIAGKHRCPVCNGLAKYFYCAPNGCESPFHKSRAHPLSGTAPVASFTPPNGAAGSSVSKDW